MLDMPSLPSLSCYAFVYLSFYFYTCLVIKNVSRETFLHLFSQMCVKYVSMFPNREEGTAYVLAAHTFDALSKL